MLRPPDVCGSLVTSMSCSRGARDLRSMGTYLAGPFEVGGPLYLGWTIVVGESL
jgi:hypothetical protein